MVTTFLSGYEIKPTEVLKLIEKILILLFNFLLVLILWIRIFQELSKKSLLIHMYFLVDMNSIQLILVLELQTWIIAQSVRSFPVTSIPGHHQRAATTCISHSKDDLFHLQIFKKIKKDTDCLFLTSCFATNQTIFLSKRERGEERRGRDVSIYDIK